MLDSSGIPNYGLHTLFLLVRRKGPIILNFIIFIDNKTALKTN